MSYSPAAAESLLSEPLFQAIPRQELARFLSNVEILDLDHDDALHIRNEPTENSYLILHGTFEVTGVGGGTAEIGEGFLGEEAALGLDTYLATAMSKGKAQVLVMPRTALLDLAKHGPIIERLMQSYGKRFTSHGEASPAKKSVAAAKPEPTVPLRIMIGWAVAIALPIALVSWLGGADILPNQRAVYLLAVLSVAVTMWVFRLLPDFVPALFSILCIILFGLAPPQVALGGFASNTLFMALSIFGLSVVITVSGLSYRILLCLLRVGPANKVWYNISLFLTGLALTPVVPTTNGRVAILAPFTNDMLQAIGASAARKEGPRLTASVMGGASLMSAIFLSSKSVNFLIFGLLPLQEQARFQWLYWLYAASLCGLVMLVLYALGTWLLFRNDSKPSISREVVADQLRILGPMKLAEWAAVFGLVILLVSFLTASIHRIEIPWVAMAILFSLLMFQFLSAKDFRASIDWSFLIYLASLIGLVAAMGDVGLDRWISANLTWLQRMMADNLPEFIAMLAIAIFIVRLALPINATVVIFATLLVPTAVNIAVNPWLIGFVVLLISESFIWPYQASYYAQFRAMARPEAGVDSPRLVTLHFLEFGMKLVAVYVSFPFWRSLGIL